MTQIALVTGANRGIGLEICRQLTQRDITAILTARDAVEGENSAAALRAEGLSVVFHALDVSQPDDVTAIHRFVQSEYGRLDILVNNAGIYPDEGVSIFDLELEVLQETLNINTIGPFMLCQAFVPMMRQQNYGRVVNVSSGYGSILEMGGYVAAYRLSKVALNALTRIVAAEVRRYNIKVNAMCPGWVKTRMGGRSAPRTPAQGADTAVWLATLPDDGPTDGFFRDRRPIAW